MEIDKSITNPVDFAPMRYDKPPLSYEQQADLLLGRGMLGDKATIIRALESVSYYRLSGYWYPFRQGKSDEFWPGTSFDEVWRRYAFDRRIRLLVMDGIERFEVAIRAWLAYEHAHSQDAFAYADDPTVLGNIHENERYRLLDDLQEELGESKETFVAHFRKKYGGEHAHMPIWMATETMTLGNLVWLYRGSSVAIKQAVAARLDVHDGIVMSWLLSLNTVRNCCAHHSRLWNRVFGVQPKIPKRWNMPITIPSERLFAVLTVLKHCLAMIASQSNWQKRLFGLFEEFPNIQRSQLGFPQNWIRCPVWRDAVSLVPNP